MQWVRRQALWLCLSARLGSSTRGWVTLGKSLMLHMPWLTYKKEIIICADLTGYCFCDEEIGKST